MPTWIEHFLISTLEPFNIKACRIERTTYPHLHQQSLWVNRASAVQVWFPGSDHFLYKPAGATSAGPCKQIQTGYPQAGTQTPGVTLRRCLAVPCLLKCCPQTRSRRQWYQTLKTMDRSPSSATFLRLFRDLASRQTLYQFQPARPLPLIKQL